MKSKTKNKKAYTYILECSDQTFYTGWTLNLNNRLTAHNKGKASKYTRARLPVKLIYSETFQNKRAAMRREYEIKKLTREKKIILLRTTLLL